MTSPPRSTIDAPRCLNCGAPLAELVGAAQIVALRIHFLDDMAAGLFAGSYRDTAAPSGAQARALAIVTRYFVSMSAAMVPLFGALLSLLGGRA